MASIWQWSSYLQQIDASELKATLNAVGQSPSDEEIFQMISQVDDDNSGEIEFSEFLKVIENQKVSAAQVSDETDTVEAFVALGGNTDKSGEISTEKLRTVVKARPWARKNCGALLTSIHPASTRFFLFLVAI